MSMGEELIDDLMLQDHQFEMFMDSAIEKSIWITKDQQEIPIKEMGGGHLQNSINYIKRGGEVYGYADQYLPLLEAELASRVMSERDQKAIATAMGESDESSK